MKNRINAALLAIAVAALIALPCFAQVFDYGDARFMTTSDPDEIRTIMENEIKFLRAEQGDYAVTGSKTKERIRKSAATITVITEEQIRNMAARNLLDVLRAVPGLGVTQNNLFMNEIESRGIKTQSTEKILFMLDGHYLDNNLLNGGGTIIFDTMPLDFVKRIEVVRGPASALYGANAFLALVHIITKEASDIDGVEVSIKRGSYQSEQYNLMYGKNIKGIDIAANFNFFDTDGFGADVEQDVLAGAPFSAAPDETDQFGKRREMDLKLGYKGLRFQGKYVQREDGHYFGANFAIDDETKTRYRDYFLEVGYNRDVLENLNFDVRLYRDFLRFDNNFQIFPKGFPDPTGDPFPNGMMINGEVDNTKQGGEILAKYRPIETNTFIAGAMAEHQKQFDIGQKVNFDPITGEFLGSVQDLSDTLPWGEAATRDLWAVYLEDLWDVTETLRFTVGARYDRYNDFGGELNPKAGVAWEFAQGYDLKLLYGHGFRAPTFAELHNINNPFIIGNSDLDPEEVETIELSVGADITSFIKSRVTFFRNDIHDLIKIQNFTHENAGSARIHGVEAELRADLPQAWPGSYVAMNYTYQHPRDREAGHRIADVPTHKANIMANFALTEHFNLYTELFIKDSLPREPGDARDELPGYGLFNASFSVKNILNSHKIFRNMELKASIYNLFDKEYYSPSPPNTIPGDYEMPGRSVMFEAGFAF